jgi:phage terminase large subunit-like protein
MIEGESGILAISPPWDRPKYIPSKRQVEWTNGAIAKTYSGENPDQLRGPQHECGWCDELAKFRYADEAWAQLQFGLRLGSWPRVLVTTTPRPIPIVRQLTADAKTGATYVTCGSTYDNAPNLAPQSGAVR